MKNLRRLTYFLSAFVLGSGVLLALVHQLGFFEVVAVPIELVAGSSEGTAPRGATAAEIRLKERLEAQLKLLTGKRIWEIDLSDVRASLAKDEWVKDVLISRAFPNEVRVRVRPKTAALIYVGKKGEFLPVTEDSTVLSALAAGNLPDVPFLRGEIFSVDRAKREAAVKFVMSLNDTGPLSRRNISEVTWTNEDGYTLTLVQPKVEVKLGDERVELKAMRVAQVLNYLSANDLKGRVIDASFSKKVLVRLRKGP